MNQKAEQLKAYFAEKNMNFFQIEEMADELNTVIFRSGIKTEKQGFPIAVVTDDTIWTLIHTQIAAGAVKPDQKAAVNDVLNAFNQNYKALKFYVNGDGDINMDICVPTVAEKFAPEMIHALIQIEMEQLAEIYPQIMEAVRAK